ncbi:MAG: ABC transporter permease [Hyphomicrobiales bacterium]
MKKTERYSEILNIALEAVLSNRIRSFLTGLGIIFGVAAVIAMMSIGKGARQEILEQIKKVGVNNIVITAKSSEDLQQESEDSDKKSSKTPFSPGLTVKDAESIKQIIPTVSIVSPEVEYKTHAVCNGISYASTVKGVNPDFFDLFNLEFHKGRRFYHESNNLTKPVCVIGSGLKSRFFPNEDPIGKYIKCSNVWYRVIGVLKTQSTTDLDSESTVSSGYNDKIFVPIKTLLNRYLDKSKPKVNDGGGGMSAGRFIMVSGGPSKQSSSFKLVNQLNRLVVQVDDSKNLPATAKTLIKMLKRRHNNQEDFEVEVPELLLKQEQKNKDIFNIVLGAIASISLIVGGIGIMNIMLASVMERIKEIGVRRSIGATKSDIILQFLAESIFISVSGGVIGIMFGVVLSYFIQKLADITTIISFSSILISFGVSAFIGIIFGFMPARKAAEQDPVHSLRHE